MRLLDRFIILIFSLLLIFASVETAFLCFNQELIETDAQKVQFLVEHYDWIILIGAAVILILGLFVMFGSAFHIKRQSKSTAINTANGNDNIQISVGAIDCIVGQVVKGYSQVKNVNTSVTETAEGVKIKAKTVVNSDVNIPELAKNLQNDIKVQLENMVGLNVKDVKIVITDVVAKPITVDKNASEKWDDVSTENETVGNDE